MKIAVTAAPGRRPHYTRVGSGPVEKMHIAEATQVPGSAFRGDIALRRCKHFISTMNSARWRNAARWKVVRVKMPFRCACASVGLLMKPHLEGNAVVKRIVVADGELRIIVAKSLRSASLKSTSAGVMPAENHGLNGIPPSTAPAPRNVHFVDDALAVVLLDDQIRAQQTLLLASRDTPFCAASSRAGKFEIVSWPSLTVGMRIARPHQIRPRFFENFARAAPWQPTDFAILLGPRVDYPRAHPRICIRGYGEVMTRRKAHHRQMPPLAASHQDAALIHFKGRASGSSAA